MIGDGLRVKNIHISDLERLICDAEMQEMIRIGSGRSRR